MVLMQPNRGLMTHIRAARRRHSTRPACRRSPGRAQKGRRMEQLPSENPAKPGTLATEKPARRAAREGRDRPTARALLTALASIALLAIAFGQETPMPVEEGQEPFAMEVLVEGLEFPWEVTYGPDDWLWVTERAGGRK